MNQTKNLFLILLVFSQLTSFSQNADQVKKRGPANEYARSSISYLLLDFENEPYTQMLIKSMNATSLPSKFDNNELSKKTMKAPYPHILNPVLGAPNGEKIRQALVAEKYAIDLVKYWWKIKPDGSYSTSLIEQRGEYNATDEVVSTMDATKTGRQRIGDLGLRLIGNSYVMVLDYYDVKSMQDLYDEQDRAARALAEKLKTEFKPVERKKNGFTGNVAAYLFRINYPDTVQGYFDDSFIDEKKIDLNKLNKIFDEVHSPMVLVSTEAIKIEATQPNPGEPLAPLVQQSADQMMDKFVNMGINKTLDRFESRLEAFRVKTPVTNVNPIRAKIGRKESLRHERRYYVWQYAESNGKIVPKRKGVIRASKVVDNKNDELGNTSESSFYQVGGGKIDVGMTLQERKDLGIGISAGFGSAGFALRGDINIGQWADLPIKQLKLYGEFISGSDEYPDNMLYNWSSTSPSDNKFSQGKFAIGILKEYPFMRNFWAGWQIGYTGETVSWADSGDGEQLTASGLSWGLKIGTNLLSPNVQLFGTINGHHNGNVTYKSGGDNSTDTDTEVKWAEIFPDKSPVSFDLSIRINF
ncbi:MAG: hypothetical protein U0W24_23925 [Bacteroidales bacterium]